MERAGSDLATPLPAGSWSPNLWTLSTAVLGVHLNNGGDTNQADRMDMVFRNSLTEAMVWDSQSLKDQLFKGDGTEEIKWRL